MRSSLSGNDLSAIPAIYSYQSRVEVWNKQPRFTPLVTVRNEHGDSALDWGEEAAVSVSLATYGEDLIQVAWCPATHGAINDPTFQNAYGSSLHRAVPAHGTPSQDQRAGRQDDRPVEDLRAGLELAAGRAGAWAVAGGRPHTH